MRIPRPMGVTFISMKINKIEDNEERDKELKKVRDMIITNWVQNNLTFNNYPMSIDAMSMYLGIDEEALITSMNKTFEKIGKIMDKQDTAVLARVLFARNLKKGLETEALLAQQASILMTSQAGEYKPFISQSVNNALANMVHAQKPLFELLKLLTDANTQNLNPSNPGNTDGYIGTDEALKIINANTQSLIQNEDALGQKLLELGPMPDVRARSQDLTSIGIKIKPTDLTSNPNGPNSTSIQEKSKQGHERILADLITDEDAEAFVI